MQEAQVEINNDKAELIIETKYKSKSNPNVSVDLDLELPRSLQLKEITSSNGNISLINCEGKSVVSTSNGGITIKECTGDFDLSTSNSSIFAQNIKGSLSATTSNGKITARVISYLKSLTTSNSSIEAEVLTLPQDLSISTNNGRIEVFLPEKLNAELLANTSNGSVKLKGVEVGTIDLGKTNLSGSLGHGGNKLRLTTSNSNIEINSINISSQ